MFCFVAKNLIKIYRKLISPLLGSSCRFWPSCSQYALESFETHPFKKALKLTIKRILRCGSGISKTFPSGGIDEVPPLDTTEK